MAWDSECNAEAAGRVPAEAPHHSPSPSADRLGQPARQQGAGRVIGGRVGRHQPAQRVQDVDAVGWKDALAVGAIQCLALIPGVSRSGATIIGGMLLGLSRKAATDFSFFLAIPTLIGAGAYSLYKERALLSVEDIPMFATGLVVSFISAWICVRWLLKYIATHSFEIFAWYRIAFGIVVLATAWTGLVDWSP